MRVCLLALLLTSLAAAEGNLGSLLATQPPRWTSDPALKSPLALNLPDPLPFRGFAAWPLSIYQDEWRHVALALDVPETLPLGTELTLGWHGAEHTVQVPWAQFGQRANALLRLEARPGIWDARLVLGTEVSTHALRVLDLAEPWPVLRLNDRGLTDASGTPVVIRQPRWQPKGQRRWAWLRFGGKTAAAGQWFIGEDFSAGLADDFQRSPAEDDLRPAASLLVALAAQQTSWPGRLVWSPGLAWLDRPQDDDERLLALVRQRAQALDQQVQCVLLLPPGRPAQDGARRRTLARSAAFYGWHIIDAERIADQAAWWQIGPDLWAAHPQPGALAQLRTALRAACELGD